MLPRALAILNCKFGAMVQTAKTHDAFILDPNRSFLPNLDGGNGAIPSAQSATYAGILNGEMLRFTHRVIFDTVHRLCKTQRYFAFHVISGFSAGDHFYNAIYF